MQPLSLVRPWKCRFPAKPHPTWHRLRRRGRRLPRRVWATMAVLTIVSVCTAVAVAGWVVSAGDMSRLPALLTNGRVQIDNAPADGVPVSIVSTPSGAAVEIDGVRRATTPAQLSLSPGSHTLGLRQPDSLDMFRLLNVSPQGAETSSNLWRRKPTVVAVRPVSPGATLANEQFEQEGGLDLSIRSGAATTEKGPSPSELWRLDPLTGSLTRMPGVSGSGDRTSVLALAPGGQTVAYATDATPTSPSRWSSIAAGSSADQTAAMPTVWIRSVGSAQGGRQVFAIDRRRDAPKTNDEHITDLIWTPDGQRLVVITRTDSTPVRSRLTLVDLTVMNTPGGGAPESTDLMIVPAELLPNSAIPDPSGHWLAFLARATTTSNSSSGVTLCIVELRSGGSFRDIADVGSVQRLAAVAPLAWAPSDLSHASARLAYVAPVPASAANSGVGPLDIFSALKPAAAPSGLFIVDMDSTAPSAGQPRRIGTMTGTAAPVWRDAATLLGFGRRDDGSLLLRSIDVASGVAHDTGAEFPPGTAQGTGLGARWDVAHGRALLVTRAGTGIPGTSPSDLQAWLVSFLPTTRAPS
jgi:PEGA domain